MPFMLALLMPPLFGVCFLLTTVDLDFGLLLGLLLMFMPGMFCMSCCAWTGRAAAPRSKKAAAMTQHLKCNLVLKLFMIPLELLRGAERPEAG